MRENKASFLSVASASFWVSLLLFSMTALIVVPRFAFAAAHPVSFDFDTSTPSLAERAPTPFSQTSNGMTAYFSSILDPAKFSIQSLLTNPNIQLS
jgi:hypothetical protein